MSERGVELYRSVGADGVANPAVWFSGDFGDMLNVSRRFFPMPKERRNVLDDVIHSRWNEVHIDYVRQIVRDAHTFSIHSLHRVGLTPSLYLDTIAGMVSGDTARLSEIIAFSESVMNRGKSPNIHSEAKFQPVYDTALMAKHQTIIEGLLGKVQPSENPSIIILVGPPGCGKTEVFKQEKDCQPGIAVNIDIDEIRKLLSPGFNPKEQKDVEQLREEAWRLADNLMAQCISTKRTMVLQTSLSRDQFWLQNAVLHDAIDTQGFNIRVKVIMRDIHDSFRRAMLRGMPMDANSDVEGRMVALGDFMDAVKGYDVVERFVREYGANLELHDYLQYSQGKTKMKSAIGAKTFRRLEWLTKWSLTLRASVVEKKADVPIEKSKNILKKI